MKTVPATEFKIHCLALLEQVNQSREPLDEVARHYGQTIESRRRIACAACRYQAFCCRCNRRAWKPQAAHAMSPRLRRRIPCDLC
jgi:hypothetical protein